MCLVEHLVTENIQRKCRNYIHKCMLLQEYGCHHDKNGQKQGTAKQQGMPLCSCVFENSCAAGHGVKYMDAGQYISWSIDLV